MFSAREVIEISFMPKNPPAKELYSIHGVIDVEKDKGVLKLVVEKPLDTLEKVIKYAKTKKLDISTLRLRGADAEEVFLNIIGEEKR